MVGTPVTGRSLPETERLVGFFSNTLVLRNDASGSPSFSQLVDRTRDTVLGALSHQQLPFEKLVEMLNPPREGGTNPLFQVMFTLRPTGVSLPELPGLETQPVRFRTNTTKLDLSLIAVDAEEGTDLVWNIL